MARVHSVVYKKVYMLLRFTTFLQMNASQMNIHAAIILAFAS